MSPLVQQTQKQFLLGKFVVDVLIRDSVGLLSMGHLNFDFPMIYLPFVQGKYSLWKIKIFICVIN